MPPQHKIVIKLCDFGAVEYVGAQTERGHKYDEVDEYTLRFRAPEVVFGDFMFTPVVDEWSVGALLWECLVGSPLFAATCEIELRNDLFRFAGSDLLDLAFCNDPSGRFPQYPRKSPIFPAVAEYPTFPAAAEYPTFPATFPERQLGRSGESLLLGLLDIDPTSRLHARVALQNYSYLQARPVLKLPA